MAALSFVTDEQAELINGGHKGSRRGSRKSGAKDGGREATMTKHRSSGTTLYALLSNININTQIAHTIHGDIYQISVLG